MVPNNLNWEKKLFKDLIRLDRGSSPRPIVNFITESDDGVNWIKIGDTNKESLYIDSTKQKITPEGAKKSRRVSKGEIILSNSMSYGQPYILNIDGCIHDGWFVIREYEDNFDKSYLLQYLGSELIQNQYKRLAAGGVVSNISSDLVYSVKANVPPLPEQQKIAKILTTWDKAINATERLIDNSKQQKKALMQQLLTGKKRLLNDEGKRFEGEWKEFKLGDLFTERVETGFNDLPLISITSSQGVISRDDVGRKDTSNSDKSKYRRILPGDIGYNTMRMWQGVSGLSYLEGIVSPAYTILKPTKSVCAEYAAYLFKLPRLVHIFERNSQGLVSDTWNLKYSNLKKIKFIFPSIPEQQKIAAVLTNADKEIELLEQQLADLQQEKKALMQVLLTGKKRVVVDG